MEEENSMNDQSASHVIDHPAKSSKPVIRQPLKTRLRVLVVDPHGELATFTDSALIQDRMLEITQSPFLPADSSVFHLALLHLGTDKHENSQLLEKLSTGLPHRIIVCRDLTSDIAKLAVQFKVDDLLTLSDLPESMYPALSLVADAISENVTIAPQTTIINGKAGSGATFITCCMSEICAEMRNKALALIDADFNYGSLAHGLRLKTDYSIDKAINELDKLDEAAVHSMMAHRENIHLIANAPFSRLKPAARTPEQLDKLCWKIRQTFPDVLVDMSKGLEYQTLPLLSQSSTIFVVMQLSVAGLRETQAMLKELKNNVDMHGKRLAIIVNRYVAGKGEIQLPDVKSVLGVTDVFTISNNFELAKLRTDLGKPLESLANHKQIEKEVRAIVHFATGNTGDNTNNKKAGFLSRLLRSK